MKTKRNIILLVITLILLLCLSIPVAETFALSTSSEMGFLSKIASAFTNPPKGSALNSIFAIMRSSDTEAPKARPKAITAGDSIPLSQTAEDDSIRGLYDNNPTALNSSALAGETAAEMTDAGAGEGSSTGTAQNGMSWANDQNSASDPAGLNTMRSNGSSGGGSLSGSGMTSGHSPSSRGSASAVQTELEKAVQPGNADDGISQPGSMVGTLFTEGASSTPSRPDRLSAGTRPSYLAGLPDTEALYNAQPDTTPITVGLSNFPSGDSPFAGNPGEPTLPDFLRDSATMNNPNADIHHAPVVPMPGDGLATSRQAPIIEDAPIVGIGLTAASIPEPTTFMLILGGLTGLCFMARKRRAG